jgi:hypothetical protein
MRQSASSLLIGLTLICLTAVPVQAQVRQAARSDSVTIVPGAQYAGGSFRRALLGTHYRDIWTTAITVAYLDLEGFAGGLVPLSSHTGSQTRSLRFSGADGRTYQFRSVFKTPTSTLRPELQNTLVADLLQDGASASHPVGTLVVAPLLEAVGVLHPKPHLYVMPDDEALGEFREPFAGVLGTLEERPDEAQDGLGGFGEAIQVIGPDRLFERIDEGPEDQVDVEAFLVARLMDILIGDRDRHRDNWRWALMDDSGPVRTWVPISRDHDEAFVKLDGALLHLATAYYPQLTSFAAEFADPQNLNWHAREVDRRFLAGLDLSAWDSAAEWVQGRLTDSVIDGAVAELPESMFAIGGEELSSSLKSRRDDLRAESARYYRILAKTVELRGTDAREVLEINRLDDRFLEVSLREDHAGAEPFLTRRFDALETGEIRVRLWGGRDRAIIRGDGNNPILLRIVGGKGRDQLVDSSAAGGVSFYDHGDETDFSPGPGSTLDQKNYEEWVGHDLDRYPPRDWGHWSRWFPRVAAGPNFGVLLGVSYDLTRYGFRKEPFRSKTTFYGGLATGEGWGQVGISSDIRLENSDARFEVDASFSGIDILRYYGLGNDTESDGSSQLHTMEINQVKLEPSLVVEPRPGLELAVGSFLRYSRTESTDAPFFASIQDTLYGAGNLGRLGASAGVRWDTRDREVASTSGVLLEAGGEVVPALWDVESTFGRLGGEARAFLSAATVPLEPTLALRAGGEQVFGDAPFQSASYLGGRSGLRGWDSERFAGDASVFGNAELRLRLAGVRIMLPTELGVFGLADVGRVYVDGESPGGWHTGVGGGIWLAFVDRASTISVAMAHSEERNAFYVSLGFTY